MLWHLRIETAGAVVRHREEHVNKSEVKRMQDVQQPRGVRRRQQLHQHDQRVDAV